MKLEKLKHFSLYRNAQEKYNKENTEINVNYVKNTDEL